MTDAPASITRFGFQFGAALVQRQWSYRGYVGVGIETPRQRLDITITPSGLIRVAKITKNEHSKASDD